jgi:hypothetical protein
MTAVVHRSFKLKPSSTSVEPAGLAHFGIAVEAATGVAPVSRAELEAEVEAGEEVETFTEVVRLCCSIGRTVSSRILAGDFLPSG